jgi:DNA-binding transcriptional LysR family regulator
MDTELLRTFLEVHRTRHFGQAAENLFLTQSAVSARIRLLEQFLNVQLFTRTRNNIQPTPAGQKLVRHAETVLTSWNRARQEIAVEEDAQVALTVGGVPSLWDILLQDWIHTLYRNRPKLSLGLEVHGAEVLLRRLADGTLDIAAMFESPQLTQLLVEEIASVRLVMVTSRPHLASEQAVKENYVLVDWGTSFALAHARLFPDLRPPAARAGLGRLAHAFILECGGSSYLAEPMVAKDVEEGRLFLVEDAPPIDRLIYAVYPSDPSRLALLRDALSFLQVKPSEGASRG